MRVLQVLAGRKATALAACAAVILLAAMGAGAYLQRLGDEAEKRRDTLGRRLLALEEALTGLQDTQIAHASFLITGSERRAERFSTAGAALNEKVSRLQALYADDAHDTRVITELRRLSALKLAELQRAAEVQRSAGWAPARAMFMSRPSDDYANAIRSLLQHLQQRDLATFEEAGIQLRQRRDQITYTAALVFALAAVAGVAAYASLRREIRERHALAQRLEHEATHDALTGLPNRRSFMQELDRALARAQRHPSQLAVLFIDLDGFKRINDELGHEAGDALLRAAARQFESALRRTDLVARLGGDEFAVLAEEVNRATIDQLGQRLIAVVSQPLLRGHPSHHVSASIGVALFPADGHGCTALLSAADGAMYAAKRAGKGRLAYASPNDNPPDMRLASNG